MEGTGGSAVFKNFSTSKGSDVTKADNKQNLVKWSSPYDSETFLDLESGNNNKKPLKKVKRHRRWKIGKVKNINEFGIFMHHFGIFDNVSWTCCL